jgi:hypothetical protein
MAPCEIVRQKTGSPAMASIRAAIRAAALALFSILVAGGAAAQAPALVAPFADNYRLLDLGAIAGVPTSYGGVFILPGHPNTLYIGGSANRSDGALYAVPITRDEGGHITGFAAAGMRVADAPYNDGGIVPDAGGLISFGGWPQNTYVQVDLATGAAVQQLDLGPFGVASAAAAVAFIPGGYPGAGGMRIASWSGGQFYDVNFSVGHAGVIKIHAVTEITGSRLPGGPEGWTYVPLGSPNFPVPSMIVAEYGADQVAVYDMDASGNPVIASRRLFIDGLSGAEGAAIDPVSGEFIFSTFGSVNHVVVVRGFARPPSVSVLPAALVFAAAAIGSTSAPQTVTVANAGPGTLAISSVTASGDFAFTSDCGASLAEGSSCDIHVSFAPIAAGGRVGTLAILTSASGSPYSVALSGTALAVATVPHAEVSPATMEFPPRPVGSESALQYVVIRNDGSGPLSFGAVTTQGDFAATQNFASSRGPCMNDLPPGGSCEIGVVFRPASAGPLEGSLRIETNAPDPVVNVRLIGTGVSTEPARSLSVPESVTFDPQRLGTRSGGRPLTIGNHSASVASITALTATGDFSVSDTCTTIAAGASCSVLVSFQPVAIGPRTGTLTIGTLSETLPYVVSLAGTGAPNPLPELALSAARAGFGNVFIGSGTVAPIVLANIGQVPVVLGTLTVSGDFFVSSACGATLAAGATCTLQVTFLPTTLGTRNGSLDIASNAEGAPRHVDLSGTGCAVPSLRRARLGLPLCAP